MSNGIDFAGAQLQLKSGTNYIYEGEDGNNQRRIYNI